MIKTTWHRTLEVNGKQVPEKDAVSIECNFCHKWSDYKKEYNDKLPRGWRDTDSGYQCNECRKRSK